MQFTKLETTVALSDGRNLTVREMSFPQAMRLAKELGNVIASIPRLGMSLMGGDAAGLIDALPAAIMQSGNAAEILILGSTDLKPKDLESLRPVDALEIITAAIPLNVTEELMGKVRSAGEALQAALASTVKPATTGS